MEVCFGDIPGELFHYDLCRSLAIVHSVLNLNAGIPLSSLAQATGSCLDCVYSFVPCGFALQHLYFYSLLGFCCHI